MIKTNEFEQKTLGENNYVWDIILIRHGQSTGNTKPEIVGGRSNHLPLSEKGKKEAQLLGKRLKKEGITFSRIYSSPAVRSLETAKAVCQEIEFPQEKIIVSDEILEMSQGEWEGRRRREVYSLDILEEFLANVLDFRTPGGESRAETAERMNSFLETYILKEPISKNKMTVGIFSHGMAIKCFLRKIMNFEPMMINQIILKNTSVTHLRYSHGQWYVMRVGDCSHSHQLCEV